MPVSAASTLMIQRAVSKRGSKADAALLEELAERCDGKVQSGVLEARHEGVEFRLRVLPKQQGWVVEVPCRFAGRFRVTRLGTLDRWMAGFVPAWRFHSRDTRFDTDFQVQTRDLELTSALLTKRLGRTVVRRLFERGPHIVQLDGDHVAATLARKAVGDGSTAAVLLNLVEELAPLARAVTAFAKRHEVRAAPKVDPVVVAAWTALGVLGVSGLGMLIAGSTVFTLVRPETVLPLCALVGLPLVGPIVFALALAVQGRTSPYGLVRGLALVTLLVVPLFVSGALLLFNGVFDTAPAEQHLVTVVGKNVRKDKDDLKYYAGLASWWTEDDVRWVRVPRSTFERLEPHQSRMHVTTHAGWLGYEWIEAYSVER